jgi:hypothetical protein
MQQQPENKQGGQRQIRLEMPANLVAQYANAVVVTHTQNEVVLDFVQVMPNDPRAKIQSRVVMTPTNAKLFLKALGDNLQRFEANHGEIKVPPRPVSLAEQLFGSVRPGDEGDGGESGESPNDPDGESQNG